VVDVLPPAVGFLPPLKEALAPRERSGAGGLKLELAYQVMRVSMAQQLGAVVAGHEVWER
jgi:hypothetical protein